ncbi:protein kinase domain-containing protein [Engelhardtia mirabilis]|uniref:Serine/threonine-protein kinase PrkC n=1 Tax=Engelhardtia mirabilis TaxID=2528011 RepID=A0A518BGN0_9BACT|nr:Serine/threonine-protein kinase PrkC [Planctomycetes bacterium Pla133]QDV00443.1 Serine/threonine-protein kinase PrkC [Planctomycetes bacterium Pla86]
MQAGDKILHYRLESELGRGGMGTVWLAEDGKLGRQVALKFLHGWVGLDGDAAARLEREARAASSLDHPGVVTVHAIESGEGGSFVVMERVRGDRIDRHFETHPRDPRQVLSVIAEAAEAVAAAHEAGIIHRDLKPSNLYVDERGRVRVLDFGLAMVRDAPQLTQTGSTVGTLGYIAPEQLRGERVGPAVDVFSLAVVLFELLTGQGLFDRGQGAPGVLHDVLERRAPKPSDFVDGLPAGTDALVARALSKDPADRPADCGVFAHELRALGASDSSAAIEALAEERAKARLRPWLIGLGLALVAAVATIGLLRPWEVSPGTATDKDSVPAAPAAYANWTQRGAGIFAEAQRDPSFSPDGRRLAFVGAVDGVGQLQVTLLDDPAPLVLTTEPRPVSAPRWSPDGESILYHVEGPTGAPDETSVHVVGVLGGQARRVLEVGRNARWHPAGDRLVFEYDGRVSTVELGPGGAVGQPVAIEGVPRRTGVVFDRMPCYSPDGAYLAFATSELGPLSTLWELQLDSGELRQVMGQRAQVQDPVYSPGGERILFSSNLGGGMTLWSLDRVSGELTAVTTGVGTDRRVAPSPDGSRLAYVNLRGEFTLGLHDTASGESRVLQRSRSPMLAPEFDPRGERVVFFGGGGPGTEIYSLSVAGGAPTPIGRNPDELEIFPQVDPSGRFVYCYTEGVDGSRFVRLPLEGGAPETVFDGWSMQDFSYPDIDPGGESLVVFDVAGLRTKIFPLSGGEPRAVDAWIFRSRWSPDGSHLVGVQGQGRVVDLDLQTLETRTFGRGDTPTYGPGGEIWFTRVDGERRHLFAVDPATGAEREVTTLGLPWAEVTDGFDVSAGGLVVWSEYAELGTEIVLLERPSERD